MIDNPDMPDDSRWPFAPVRLPPGAPLSLRVLRFCDLVEDTDPTKLSWTKIGVASSTLYSIGASVITMFETHWAMIVTAIGLHSVSHAARAVKRYTESP